MFAPRIFNVIKFLKPNDGEPIRSVVTESQNAVVLAWHLKPSQRISTHIHPEGQDTWTILSGKGENCLNESGETMMISAGNVIVAHTGEAHGVLNTGKEPLVFISVISQLEAGYELV